MGGAISKSILICELAAAGEKSPWQDASCSPAGAEPEVPSSPAPSRSQRPRQPRTRRRADPDGRRTTLRPRRRPTAMAPRRASTRACGRPCRREKLRRPKSGQGREPHVRKGEAVGLLGPNGAGKTTVFYMITGLITADHGRIELDGHDHRPADVSACAPRYRLFAAGSLDFPRPQGRGEHPRRA